MSAYSTHWPRHPVYVGGTAQITNTAVNGRVRATSSGYSIYTRDDITFANADYSIKVDLTNLSFSRTGVVLRFNQTADTGYIIWVNDGDAYIDLNKNVNGSGSLLVKSNIANVTPVGQTKTMEVIGRTVDANTVNITVKINDVEVINYNDTAANRITAANRAGLVFGGTNFGDTAGIHADNFIVSDLSTDATDVTLSGPSSGFVNVASTDFIVALSPEGGSVAGTVTVTPSDGGAGGTFTPSSVGLTTASPSATFTYTPNSTGTKNNFRDK